LPPAYFCISHLPKLNYRYFIRLNSGGVPVAHVFDGDGILESGDK
jgi:hypothetical protein